MMLQSIFFQLHWEKTQICLKAYTVQQNKELNIEKKTVNASTEKYCFYLIYMQHLKFYKQFAMAVVWVIKKTSEYLNAWEAAAESSSQLAAERLSAISLSGLQQECFSSFFFIDIQVFLKKAFQIQGHCDSQSILDSTLWWQKQT